MKIAKAALTIIHSNSKLLLS